MHTTNTTTNNNFNNITLDNFIDAFSKNCSKALKKSFIKNQSITSFIKNRNQICILLSGHADLIRYDLSGNRSIVEHFSNNDIFGEAFYTITTNNELSVVAKTHCEVLFFTYEDIYNKNCSNSCNFHNTLKKFFPELVLKKITTLNERIELLTGHSTRDKLIRYFSFLSKQNLSKTFKLDSSLTDLADYLNVDRSAMMRELTILKTDGFIEKSGNRITLLIE